VESRCSSVVVHVLDRHLLFAEGRGVVHSVFVVLDQKRVVHGFGSGARNGLFAIGESGLLLSIDGRMDVLLCGGLARRTCGDKFSLTGCLTPLFRNVSISRSKESLGSDLIHGLLDLGLGRAHFANWVCKWFNSFS